ncbi:hypothetical protein [Actinoplanes regularis]|uniref:hypothetical protein n=1 Tax=Actinoplanes regularis TaxID=52697 RepID=UPI0024A124AE|nr:hypothetical protein [Actinoplanes regularis]GLW36054.1 hypothetical protein Areg01_89880 [Actinoplanes regularis]
MKPPKAVTLAMIGLILSVPPAAWWLIGDQTSQSLIAEGVELDYAYRAVSLGTATDRVIGVLACTSVVSTLGMLLWATVTRRLRAGWWLVLLPLAAAGIALSYAWRVSTIGVLGGNFGPGLAVLVGGPLIAGLITLAAVMARRMPRTRMQSPDHSVSSRAPVV